MTGSAAALVSSEASGLLAELAGVRVEAKQVERVAEGLRPPSVGRARAALRSDDVPRSGRHRRAGAPDRFQATP